MDFLARLRLLLFGDSPLRFLKRVELPTLFWSPGYELGFPSPLLVLSSTICLANGDEWADGLEALEKELA